MEKFEYKTIERKTSVLFGSDLTYHGARGWELISVITINTKGTTSKVQYIFKRKLSE